MKKKRTALLIALLLATCLVAGLTGCQKETTPATNPQGTEESSEPNTENEAQTNEESSQTEKEETNDPTESSSSNPSDALETLSISLGNDMGRTITALKVRPSAEDEWINITLQDGSWASGLMIPVEIKAETIPNPASGWELEVEFADDGTSRLFEQVPLNTESSIILTEDGFLTGA